MTREMLSYFNLSKHPFSKEIITDDLLTLPSIQRALQTLELLVDTKGIGCLTGKSGTGKSCLIRMLMKGMPSGLVKPVYLCHTSIGVMEFYTHLANALGLPPGGRRAALFRAVQERIYTLHRTSRTHTVLIVDEAHLLSNEILKELRLLSNFEVDSVNAMTILLCGQESLLQKFGLSILGVLVAGTVGTDARREYTVIGDTVNVASRIESQTKVFETDILVSEETVAMLGDGGRARFALAATEPITMRGKSRAMVLYTAG